MTPKPHLTHTARVTIASVALALTCLALLLTASAASADLSLCQPGEAAGQCEVGSAQRGLAVDTADGLLYVADEANDRINVFKADGEFHFAFGWGVRDGTSVPQTCGPGASPPSATCLKGLAGSGPGQLDRPTSVVVDNDPASPSQHAIYVAEQGVDEGVDASRHPRVQRFDPTGDFVWMVGDGVDQTDGGDLCTAAEGHTCGKANVSSTEGGFASLFLSIGVGPGGVLYAVDGIFLSGNNRRQRLQRFEPSGAQIPTQATLLEGENLLPRSIAVDAAGDLWVASISAGLRKHCSPTWTSCAGPFEAGADFRSDGLAIDAAGTLYAAQSEARDKGIGKFNAIAAFDPAGNVFRRFAYTPFNGGANALNGLAAHTSAFGDLFFSRAGVGVAYVFEPPSGPVAAPPSLEVPSPGAVKATAFAEVNPEGEATDVHFEYLSQADWEAQGEDFAGPATRVTPTVDLGAEGFELKTTEALLGCPDPVNEASEAGKCLTPETTYRWWVLATNEDGAGAGTVEGPPFTTTPSLDFGQLYATAVGSDSARLHAELNPQGVPTTGHFEYVTEAAYQQDIGAGGDGFAAASKAPLGAPLDFGSGEAFATRSLTVSPLDPATTYRYRMVADNPLIEPAPSEATEVLRTFAAPQADPCANDALRTGAATLLPDCRAYEMVSPPDKDGGDVRPLLGDGQRLAVLEQSSHSGGRLAYGSYRAFGDAASAPWTSQYIAERIEGSEWRSHAISPPRTRSIFTVLQQVTSEFKAFSADLCDAWMINFADPPLAEAALAGYSNLYRRTDQLCSEDGEAHYEALAPIEAPASLPPGSQQFFMKLLGLSAGGEHAIFLASDSIAPEGAPKESQLYLSAPGAASRMVCIGPDAVPSDGSCTAGSELFGGVSPQIGKISADGSRLFWSSPGSGEGKLYARLNPTEPESARLHGVATGNGTLIGPATGSGNVATGSKLVKNTKLESGAFAVGQQISDANGAIPAGTTIVKIDETAPAVFTFTLSAEATKVKVGDLLTGAASATVPALLTETGAFEAGQQITAAGIPPGTTVLSCSPACGPPATALTLSQNATKTEVKAHLSATSPCTEAATRACTIQISKAGEEATGTSKSWFWGAAGDGSVAIFSTQGDFSRSDLYEFDVDGEETELIAGGVLGVLGISEDAARLYFASSQVLTGEEANGNGDKAQAGKPNLYLRESDGSIEFIATLAGADLEQAVSKEYFGKRSSRVSPDGARAAFVSVAPLTGYDNKDAQSGAETVQLYRYDADAEELLCVSCNPSGARPAGPSSIPMWQTGMHAARVLAAGGSRLYFHSADALAPRDTNGALDVYQWEQPGAGACTLASATFSPQNGGCLDLISSGQSPQDARFVEASPTGDDVFFATASALLPQDPGGVDIYDARAGGGLPIPAGPPPGCEGEACQSPPEAPTDPTPASSAFEGAGNVVKTPARPRCAKGKRRVIRKGRASCVPRKRGKPAKRANRNKRAAR
jgi:hypothetical protein